MIPDSLWRRGKFWQTCDELSAELDALFERWPELRPANRASRKMHILIRATDRASAAFVGLADTIASFSSTAQQFKDTMVIK